MKETTVHKLILILYLSLTLSATYPLITKINSGIYGFPSDNIYQMHDVWFYKIRTLSLVVIKSPVDINSIEHDHLSTTPVLDIVATALAIPTNPLISYNLLILFGFVSSAFFAYLLCLKLTGNKLASFVGGIIFSFSPYHYALSQNHIELSQIEVIPIFGLLLLRYLEKRTIRNAVILGVSLGLITLTVNYYGYFLGILTTLVILASGASPESEVKRGSGVDSGRSRLLSFARMTLVFAVTFSIIGLGSIPYLRAIKTTKDLETITWKRMQRSENDFFTYSARPWFFVLPDIKNPIIGRFSQKALHWISQKPPYFLTQTFFENEHSLYLGWVAILLAIFGLIRNRKDKKVQVIFAIALLFGLLSAPPYATLAEKKVYFPSFILAKLIPQFRVYARTVVIIQMCLAILASFGVRVILEKINKKSTKVIIVSLFSIFILVDSYKAGRFTKLLPLPDRYKPVAENPKISTIIEIPKPVDATHLFYQMYHQKEVIGLEDFSKLDRVVEIAKKDVLVIVRKDAGERYNNLIKNEKGLIKPF